MAGWIKLHRSILDKGWIKKPEYVQLWVVLLLMASHDDREYFWNGKTIILKSGQLITGRKALSEKTGINENKIERILKCFKSEQQIEQQTTSSSRLISILNWDKFQQSEQPFEQRVNNDRTTSEQRVNTNKELKKDNNLRIKEKGVVNKFTPPQLSEVVKYFQLNQSTIHDAEKFHDHFTSNGWLVSGKARMKDWQASARNWIKNSKKWNKENGTKPSNKPATVEQIISHFANQPQVSIKLGDYQHLIKKEDTGNPEQQ
jgi:hypothetical protein